MYKSKELINKKNEFIFTDKTLDNFFFVGLIKKIFPSSKYINCKRKYSSSIMSIIKNNLGAVSWAHDLEHIFQYDPDEHVRGVYRPNPDDSERTLLKTQPMRPVETI